MKRFLSNKRFFYWAASVLILLGGIWLWVHRDSLEVRLDQGLTVLRVWLWPLGAAPTPMAVIETPQKTESVFVVTETPLITTPFPEPRMGLKNPGLPVETKLAAPAWEMQDWNNCGPATLTMYLRFYGWQGVQADIARRVKPVRTDRNVRPDELVQYVTEEVKGYQTVSRVGGSLQVLHNLLAAGIPVMIEEAYHFDHPFWFQDDLWDGHYLLITGYNDRTRTFIVQDSQKGSDQLLESQVLDGSWQAFNRLYLLVYRAEDENKIRTILGPDWDVEQNYQHALDTARLESSRPAANAYAWFNLGTNLVYFKQYSEAARAYDHARSLTLPQRMLRYQFGLFAAYYYSQRWTDLNGMLDYALRVTPDSEEALLWQGLSLYRQGRKNDALNYLRKAQEARPGYADAADAINYIKSH